MHERLQKDKFQKADTKPYRLRLVMEELGGAFVKLGQLLSLRPDLIPKEYCEEKPLLFEGVNRKSSSESAVGPNS